MQENSDNRIPILGQAVWNNGQYVIREPAKTGSTCAWMCPKCRKISVMHPYEPGQQTVVCKNCNARILITVVGLPQSPAPSPQGSEDPETVIDFPKQPAVTDAETVINVQPTNDDVGAETVISNEPKRPPVTDSDGELTWGGRFSRSTFRLRIGSTIVGRNDPKTKSDINIDDPEVSRRSVRIDAEQAGQAFVYRLTVLKSLNPVTVDGEDIAAGQTVSLHYGQTIVMGSTKITFRKVNK